MLDLVITADVGGTDGRRFILSGGLQLEVGFELFMIGTEGGTASETIPEVGAIRAVGGIAKQDQAHRRQF